MKNKIETESEVIDFNPRHFNFLDDMSVIRAADSAYYESESDYDPLTPNDYRNHYENRRPRH